ncbi:choice-of-anchor E domain-containing protein [Tolypothrix sp. PCC 7910]|uniref:choice-of-anchor E domain-containing protein n=1 Tax=Tolypothrix sp. PCC 7910 TaxID=2099387 RepID=UPI0014277399|nr:choice-of-anchor E domain-containing protein [Tolypothrix sp. PCC 7910]QIR37895.1 choice-of-anchor E domain-containing protein [Tolypothrix sp. PCC 7910]
MNSKFFQALATATTFAGIIATSGVANAASLSFSASTDFARTDFEKTLSLTQFNSALGELESVTIKYQADIKANGSFTNTGPKESQATIILGGETFGSNLGLELKDQFQLNLSPTKTSNFKVAGFSTVTLPDIVATGLETKTLSKGVDNLNAFIGNANVNFLFTALARSAVIGPGNVSSQINTFAQGMLEVTYQYNETPKPVPESSAVLGLGLIAGLGILLNTKKIRVKTSSF